MSYDIRLTDPVTKEVIYLASPHLLAGGTYIPGGTTEAWLNITYNYSRYFETLGPKGLREIYNKTGAESIPLLETCIQGLNDDTDSDYWKATEGNAKQALLKVKALAQLRPDGIWKGD